MIKLLATDLDGTLLYPKYNILDLPRKNKRFLKQFIASGGQVVIASGRGINLLPKLERSVGSKMALLGCNGAFLYKDGVFHTSHPLNNSDALELFTNCYFNYSILFWFLFDQTNKMYLYCGDRSFVKNITAFGNLFLGIRRERAIFDKKVFLSKFDGDSIYKLTVSFGLGKYSYQAARESYFAFMERFSDKFSIALSNNGIEFTALNVNKGRGLLEYTKTLGIKPEEVAVCGDSGNDIPMFDIFPHSFCMVQGAKEVQKHASHIVKGVYEIQDYLAHPERMEKDYPGERK